MRKEIINIRKVLPIEIPRNLDFRDAVKYSKDPIIFNPPTLVQYHDLFIAGEGHRRTLSRVLRGEKETQFEIVESDGEISLDSRGAFWRVNSIKEFIEKYEKCWKPGVVQAHIKTFYDYLNYIPTKLLNA